MTQRVVLVTARDACQQRSYLKLPDGTTRAKPPRAEVWPFLEVVPRPPALQGFLLLSKQPLRVLGMLSHELLLGQLLLLCFSLLPPLQSTTIVILLEAVVVGVHHLDTRLNLLSRQVF